MLTAVCVSTSGVIGFIGLIVPHLIRIGFTAKHRYLLPLSAVVGGLVLMLSDNISRLMFQVEIPVGVITTLIGGPFFIYIYMNKKGEIL
jgi:iron complex transport system permease protein